ncbi:hypothetical protein CBL_08821 [Carabus blaptoides fortunei]
MIKLIFYYFIFILHIAVWNGYVSAEKSCAVYDGTKQQCSENEMCQYNVCKCKLGYTRLGEGCVKNMSNQVPSPAPYGPHPKTPEEGTSHVAAAVIIPIMMILFVIGSVVLVRKYNVVSWVRNKLNQRHTPYDEVMIGQDDDDPPLAGV